MINIDFFNVDFSDLLLKYIPVFLHEYSFEIDELNGDFLIQETVQQESEFILIAKKGQFYFEPFIGYDINRLQNARVDLVTERGKILTEFAQDGIIGENILIGRKSDALIRNNVDPAFLSTIDDQLVLINYNVRR